MASSDPSGDRRIPQAGGSPVPTAKAGQAAGTLGQEDAAIAALPENATEPDVPAKSSQSSGKSAADAPEPSDRNPPAGAHADPKLMNPDATPGTGALTPTGGHDDVDAASG